MHQVGRTLPRLTLGWAAMPGLTRPAEQAVLQVGGNPPAGCEAGRTPHPATCPPDQAQRPSKPSGTSRMSRFTFARSRCPHSAMEVSSSLWIT